MQLETQRIWAEVDLGAIEQNFRLAQGCVGQAAVWPVVKADAYGHGALPVAKILAAAGAQGFCVATAEEALALRESGIEQPLLVLGVVPPAAAHALAAANIAVALDSLPTAQAYAAAVVTTGLQKVGITPPLRVHLKVDTGMARLGMPVPLNVEELREISALPGIGIEGVFTHFAIADERAGDEYTAGQLALFETMLAALQQEGMQPLYIHCANSGGVLRWPHSHKTMVRPGIMLYGYAPAADCENHRLRPAMTLNARVMAVHEVEEGTPVGYGCAWRAPRKSRIATLAAGYADGLPRVASNRFNVLINGRKAPQVGRICMDMCMVDVTELSGVQAGDVAMLFGPQHPATHLAEAAITIPYEIVCGVSARVPRIYVNGREA